MVIQVSGAYNSQSIYYIVLCRLRVNSLNEVRFYLFAFFTVSYTVDECDAEGF
jgi:hypothetical protein